MKRIIIILCSFALLVPVFAQIPSAGDVILGKLLGIEMKNIIRNVEMLEKARKTAAAMKQTKEDIEAMYKLQLDVREAVRDVSSIRDLKWGDVGYIGSQAFGFSLNPAEFIPNTPETANLRSVINQEYFSAESARTLDLILNKRFTVPGNVVQAIGSVSPDSYKMYANYQNERISNQLSYETYQNTQNYKRAVMLRKMADALYEKALEMSELIKMEGKFEMAIAERLQLQAEAHNLLRQSIDLRRQADALVNTSPSETTKTYKEAMENQAMGRLTQQLPISRFTTDLRRF